MPMNLQKQCFICIFALKMKILLLGEYSNVHCTLAEGLRALGHEVTVASDGDGWKNYPRDIDLRRPTTSKKDGILFYLKALKSIRQLRGYDVVQLINPVFLPLKAERIRFFYNILRKQNKSMFLGAYGMDHYWAKAGLDCKTFRYSDFNLGNQIRQNTDNEIWINDWLIGPKGKLNQYIANDCDGIISGLYEYDASYRPYFAEKLQFIPFPINSDKITLHKGHDGNKVRFFIGIQRARSSYKGTDIMLRALERVVNEMPDRCEMIKVESVPFAEYEKLMNSSDVILDQLYSYTPAMNALLGMAKGLIVVGGGEPENYDILHETSLRPIINVQPNEDSVYQSLRNLVLHKESIPVLSSQSIEYIHKHHHHLKVSQKYIDFWKSKIL